MRKSVALIAVLLILALSAASAAENAAYSVDALDEFCEKWNDFYRVNNDSLNGSYSLTDDGRDISAYYITFNEEKARKEYATDLIPATSTINVIFLPEDECYLVSIIDSRLKSDLENIVIHGNGSETVTPVFFSTHDEYDAWTIMLWTTEALEFYLTDDIRADITVDGETRTIDIDKTRQTYWKEMFDWLLSAHLYASNGSFVFRNSEYLPAGQPEEKKEDTKTDPSYSFRDDVDGINDAAKSVFYVEMFDKKLNSLGTASGFVAFDEHLLVTNQHVIDGAAYLMLYDEDSNAYLVNEVAVSDKKQDIAILKFAEGTKYHALKLNTKEDFKRGQPVVAIGSPESLQNTVTKGDISAIREEGGIKMIQISAAISNGSSGGALFDNSGSVIGITSAGLIEGQNLNFAISVRAAQELYNSWEKGDYTELGSEESWDTVKYQAERNADPPDSRKEGIVTQETLKYTDRNAGISFVYPEGWSVEGDDPEAAEKELILSSDDSSLTMILYTSSDIWSALAEEADREQSELMFSREEADFILMNEEIAKTVLKDYDIEELVLKTYGGTDMYTARILAGEETTGEKSAGISVAYFANNGYTVTFTMLSLENYEETVPVFEEILQSVRKLNEAD